MSLVVNENYLDKLAKSYDDIFDLMTQCNQKDGHLTKSYRDKIYNFMELNGHTSNIYEDLDDSELIIWINDCYMRINKLLDGSRPEFVEKTYALLVDNKWDISNGSGNNFIFKGDSIDMLKYCAENDRVFSIVTCDFNKTEIYNTITDNGLSTGMVLNKEKIYQKIDLMYRILDVPGVALLCLDSSDSVDDVINYIRLKYGNATYFNKMIDKSSCIIVFGNTRNIGPKDKHIINKTVVYQNKKYYILNQVIFTPKTRGLLKEIGYYKQDGYENTHLYTILLNKDSSDFEVVNDFDFEGYQKAFERNKNVRASLYWKYPKEYYSNYIVLRPDLDLNDYGFSKTYSKIIKEKKLGLVIPYNGKLYNRSKNSLNEKLIYEKINMNDGDITTQKVLRSKYFKSDNEVKLRLNEYDSEYKINVSDYSKKAFGLRNVTFYMNLFSYLDIDNLSNISIFDGTAGLGFSVIALYNLFVLNNIKTRFNFMLCERDDIIYNDLKEFLNVYHFSYDELYLKDLTLSEVLDLDSFEINSTRIKLDNMCSNKDILIIRNINSKIFNGNIEKYKNKILYSNVATGKKLKKIYERIFVKNITTYRG